MKKRMTALLLRPVYAQVLPAAAQIHREIILVTQKTIRQSLHSLTTSL